MPGENNQLVAPPEAMGALYFLPGQYLFKRIENGRQVSKAVSGEQVARAFRETRNDTGWLTRRVLRGREELEGSYILSYEPAQIRTIQVMGEDNIISELTLPLPGLVLFGHRQEYYMWAVRASRNITKDTQLAVAPLPNIGGNLSGKICFGGNTVPEANFETIGEVWRLVYDTPFNGDQVNRKCHSEPEDVRRLLFRLAAAGKHRFPAGELLVSSTTIGDLWRNVVESKRYGY